MIKNKYILAISLWLTASYIVKRNNINLILNSKNLLANGISLIVEIINA